METFHSEKAGLYNSLRKIDLYKILTDYNNQGSYYLTIEA